VFLRVPKLLSEEQLATIDAALDQAVFVDGADTSGPVASQVKNNLQLDRGQTAADVIDPVDRMFAETVMSNIVIRGGVMPRKVIRARWAKYTEGMSYGPHTDNPLMMEGGLALRTDASITVFLSEPEDYEGGELLIQGDIGETRVKLARGDAVIYPTGAIHAVAEVTGGERRVAVSWLQSMVADPYKRQLLYEFDLALRGINEKMADSTEARVLLKTYGNLIRLWSEI